VEESQVYAFGCKNLTARFDRLTNSQQNLPVLMSSIFMIFLFHEFE
jgi:hypothetical protein